MAVAKRQRWKKSVKIEQRKVRYSMSCFQSRLPVSQARVVLPQETALEDPHPT